MAIQYIENGVVWVVMGSRNVTGNSTMQSIEHKRVPISVPWYYVPLLHRF